MSQPKFALAFSTFLMATTLLQAQQPYPYEREKAWPANQTIADLKAISTHNTFNPREMDRYDNAMTHLSQFAEKLHMGHFDKGKLDQGIDDVHGILTRNPLDGRARDILNRDMSELRRLRATYKISYY